MEEPKPQKQQIIPPEPGSTLLLLAESLPSILTMVVLYNLLSGQTAIAQTQNIPSGFTLPPYEGALKINLPKSCANLVTNPEIVASLIKAGLPANATVISFIGHKVRYHLGDCKDVFTADVKYTGNGYLAVGLRAPTLPTKIKPKN